MLLNLVNQIARGAVERLGQSKQHSQRGLIFSQFEFADIDTLDFGLECQLLLRKTGVKPACAQYESEGFRCFQIHSHEMGALSV
ncbi:hypothetical protein R69776_05177 [Paraburkholderia nemoris]|uniref:Uncharacterized protein n=1 Tax=Paraburkholderia nemoris TaxID=2793076 RepID=A0ABM8SBQ3_9BURK|nr:hypothetical protein R75777_00010 [Paraburkholderia nemoris]CAE6800117.1 hypothetical protein R69776_05177 [Paraburkholderia nemoris]